MNNVKTIPNCPDETQGKLKEGQNSFWETQWGLGKNPKTAVLMTKTCTMIFQANLQFAKVVVIVLNKFKERQVDQALIQEPSTSSTGRETHLETTSGKIIATNSRKNQRRESETILNTLYFHQDNQLGSVF